MSDYVGGPEMPDRMWALEDGRWAREKDPGEVYNYLYQRVRTDLVAADAAEIASLRERAARFDDAVAIYKSAARWRRGQIRSLRERVKELERQLWIETDKADMENKAS